MSLLRDADSVRARVEARQAAEKRKKKQAWLETLRGAGINRRFALEIHNHYGTFPTADELEGMWDTDVGKKIREHFGIDRLRYAEGFEEFGMDPERATEIMKAFRTSDQFLSL
jgi:hypothetical protein